MRAPLIALALCGALLGTPAQAADAEHGDLAEVMGLLAARRHASAEFIEQQFLAVLTHPVESSGELRYDAPDRLEKRTLQPRAEALLMNGDVLTVERGGRRRVMDLHDYPQILPFIESIRATLAGDQSALGRDFQVSFDGGVARWTLTLVPLQSDLKQTLARVRIEGARDQLLSVEIRQKDGDHSLMTLRPSSP